LESVGKKKNINKKIKSLNIEANILKKMGNKIAGILNNLNKNKERKNINNNSEYYDKIYEKIIKSNDKKFIQNEIDLILINSNGKTLGDKIDDYIKSELSVMVKKKLFKMENILSILQEIYNPILDGMYKGDIRSYLDCWFFLAYCVKIDNEYSIFSKEDRITTRKHEIGFGIAYNILSNSKFNSNNGLKHILEYLSHNNDKMYNLLKDEIYTEYDNVFLFSDDILHPSQNLSEIVLEQSGKQNLNNLIEDLISSSSFVGRCILLKNYLDKYKATFFLFDKKKSESYYTSFSKTYKKHSNKTKMNKQQVFTYIFFKLYKDMTEKNKFKSEIKKFRNNKKNLTIKELDDEIKKINTSNKNGKKNIYYKNKTKLLKTSKIAKTDFKTRMKDFKKNIKKMGYLNQNKINKIINKIKKNKNTTDIKHKVEYLEKIKKSNQELKNFKAIINKLSDNELENEYNKLLSYKLGNTSTNLRSKLLNIDKNKLSHSQRKILNNVYRERITIDNEDKDRKNLKISLDKAYAAIAKAKATKAKESKNMAGENKASAAVEANAKKIAAAKEKAIRNAEAIDKIKKKKYNISHITRQFVKNEEAKVQAKKNAKNAENFWKAKSVFKPYGPQIDNI
jgi:hypothetical protein